MKSWNEVKGPFSILVICEAVVFFQTCLWIDMLVSEKRLSEDAIYQWVLLAAKMHPCMVQEMKREKRYSFFFRVSQLSKDSLSFENRCRIPGIWGTRKMFHILLSLFFAMWNRKKSSAISVPNLTGRTPKKRKKSFFFLLYPHYDIGGPPLHRARSKNPQISFSASCQRDPLKMDLANNSSGPF